MTNKVGRLNFSLCYFVVEGHVIKINCGACGGRLSWGVLLVAYFGALFLSLQRVVVSVGVVP